MTASGTNTFVLSGRAAQAGDIFGVWNPAQDSTDLPESFDLGSAQNSGPAVFVCDLPANPEQAEFELAQAETALQSNLASLQDSQARLDQLVHIQAGGVAFDVPGYPPSPGYPPGPGYSPGSPESQLLALLGTSVPDGEWDPSSFGAGEAVSGQWQKIAVGFQEFMDRLNQVVGHFAWVETQINGKLIVRSSVGWTGNLDTAWNAAPTHESAALHQRTLRLALTSRTAMLRAFGVISAGAVKLTALVASPAGAVLALPAAWNFIRQVQAESARYASIKQEIGNG